MQELVSPAQSESVVLLASEILFVCGAVWGWKTFGARGVLCALIGPLLWGLWEFHNWITRYDSHTGYFGLDKVWVLLLEIVLFVALGAAAGIVCRNALAKKAES